LKKFLKVALIVLVVAFVLAQFIRPAQANPPVDPAKTLKAPADVQAILDRSCGDCHSNNTRWPWYAKVAPVSWWLADHVKDGRREINISEFATYSPRKAAHKMEEVCEQVEKGEMPLSTYLPLHPDAKLSDADKARLCAWAKSEQARIKAEHPAETAPRPRPPSGSASGASRG
jgi:hypothetical protein